MENVKKPSTPAISPAETSLLLELVKKYKDIIECKETNSIKNRQKTATWLLIEQEFNRASPRNIFRSHIVLRNKFKNLKKRTMKKYTDEKIKIKRIGGGPYEPTIFDETDMTEQEIIGEKRVAGRRSEFDNNAAPVFESPNSLNPESSMFDNDVDVEVVGNDDIFDLYEDSLVVLKKDSSKKSIEGEVQFQQSPVATIETSDSRTVDCKDKIRNWTKNTVPVLGTKRRECLLQKDSFSEEPISIIKKAKSCKDLVTALASGKATLNALQQTAFQEEHNLKLKLMQEAHDVKMKHEECIRNLQEEELRTRIQYWKVKLLKEKKDVSSLSIID